MNRLFSAALSAQVLLAITLSATGCGAKPQTTPQPTPQFMVILWGGEHNSAPLVKQGTIPDANFRRLFLQTYFPMVGERIRPPEGSPIVGLVVAHDASSVVSVPITKWKANDGRDVFNCGADVVPGDGVNVLVRTFSVFANSEDELFARIEKMCGGE